MLYKLFLKFMKRYNDENEGSFANEVIEKLPSIMARICEEYY